VFACDNVVPIGGEVIKPAGGDYARALLETDSMADAEERFSGGLLGAFEVIGTCLARCPHRSY
jgi:hypothetical protein